jgi:serine kinase of HPr protein (carbohydrate metabolism regulator)
VKRTLLSLLEVSRLTDVTVQASFDYNGEIIQINRDSLIEIRDLGYGNYARMVKLVRVRDHPEITLAVKVTEIMRRHH